MGNQKRQDTCFERLEEYWFVHLQRVHIVRHGHSPDRAAARGVLPDSLPGRDPLPLPRDHPHTGHRLLH